MKNTCHIFQTISALKILKNFKETTGAPYIWILFPFSSRPNLKSYLELYYLSLRAFYVAFYLECFIEENKSHKKFSKFATEKTCFWVINTTARPRNRASFITWICIIAIKIHVVSPIFVVICSTAFKLENSYNAKCEPMKSRGKKYGKQSATTAFIQLLSFYCKKQQKKHWLCRPFFKINIQEK